MAHNRLYRFITGELLTAKAVRGLEKSQFLCKTNKEQKNYVMYRLVGGKKVMLSAEQGWQYHLKTHHVSFYEIQVDNNTYLSQYHYTAYFVDQNNKKYQLHVYFNQKDQVATSPVFSLQDADDKQAVSAEFSESLVQFAIEQSVDFMAELRQQHREKLAGLENRYGELERQLVALSLDLPGNRGVYLQRLDEAIGVVELLSRYHEDKQYESLAGLFKRIKYAVESLPVDAVIAAEQDAPNLGKPALPASPVAMPRESTPMVVKQSLEAWVQRAIEARDAYFAAIKEENNSAYAEQVQAFLGFHQHTHQALLFSDDDGYQVTVKQVQKIQQLLTENIAQAKKLLENILLKSQFELAYTLRQFVNPVPEKWVKMALATGNAKLLDFLLTHGDVAMNTFTVREGLSPVLFCFTKHNEKLSKAECLAVLVKHKASVMVSAADGLPVAHHILSVANHPLQKALLDNVDAAGKIKLYKAVLHHIDSYLIDRQLSTADKEALLIAMERYTMDMPSLAEVTSAINSRVMAKAMAAVEKVQRHDVGVPASELEAIKADKEVREKKLKLDRLTKELMSKVTPMEKRRLIQQGGNYYENLDKLLDIMVVDTQNLKQQALLALENQIEITQLNLETVELQKELRKPSYHQNDLKRKEGLLQRHKEILERIKILRLQCGFLDDKELEKREEAHRLFKKAWVLLNKDSDIDLIMKQLVAKEAPVEQEAEEMVGGVTLEKDFDDFALAEASETPSVEKEEKSVALASVAGMFAGSGEKTDDAAGKSLSAGSTL